MLPIALTIAGSDPGGGAGIQADLKVFHQFRVYGTAAITLITVQNTLRLSRVVPLQAELVAQQIDAVLGDLAPGAIKTGALGTREMIEAVASRVAGFRLVVDPVMIGSLGMPLTDDNAVDALRDLLLPRAELVTPNLPEAARLTGIPVENVAQMKEAALKIAGFGSRSVFLKGGHLEGDPIDILLHEGVFTEFPTCRVITNHTHGTGCTLSAAITALLAHGLPLHQAVSRAKRFVIEAIATAPGLGGGSGPLNHWAVPSDSL